MGVSIATIIWQILGGLIMIAGAILVVCAITFVGVTLCALFYPSIDKMFNKWFNWVKGRLEL